MLIRTDKWPAPNVSGFIAQLVRASHRYREVTGSNPVEVLTLSGFYTQLRKFIYNLFQHVSGSTHRRGHTLDLIITRKDESLIKEVEILHDIYSDHRVVTCKLNFAKPPRSKILVTCRNNKTFDSDRFRLDLTDALSQLILDQDISVDTYNATLGKVYDAHLPLQTRWVTHRPCCAWYTSDLRAMKREKRQAERKFRKSRLEVHRKLFEESCASYNSLLESTKCSYYRQKLENSNTKQLFRMIDSFFHSKITSITDT